MFFIRASIFNCPVGHAFVCQLRHCRGHMAHCGAGTDRCLMASASSAATASCRLDHCTNT